MALIYVKDGTRARYRWRQLEDTNIASFLGDPVRTGNIFLHTSGKPILEEVADGASREQYRKFYQDCVHFATNYGLAGFFGSGTTHIAMPNTRGYILIQLTDLIVDIGRFPENSSVRINLIANMSKMSDVGTSYRIDSTFEEIMEELARNYRFIGPPQDQMIIPWLLGEIRSEVVRQREAVLDEDFVARVNRLHSSTHIPEDTQSMEDLRKHFLDKYCPI